MTVLKYEKAITFFYSVNQYPAILSVPSSQRHTLPNRDYIYSISEVIILNNDQHQQQKITSTNNRIN